MKCSGDSQKGLRESYIYVLYIVLLCWEMDICEVVYIQNHNGSIRELLHAMNIFICAMTSDFCPSHLNVGPGAR